MKYYLVDVIAADGMEHPVFDTDARRAMPFLTLRTAMDCRTRLIAMGHDPHIESYVR